MITARTAGLVLAAAALAALGCRDETPTLVLKIAPPDAAVTVDGYAHPGGSPHEIRFKAPGRYKLEVGRDGYRPVEMFVTLAAGERREQVVELVADGTIGPDLPMPDVPPPPLLLPPATPSFPVRISSSPPGAQIELRDPGSPTVRSGGVTPTTIDLPVIGATEVTLKLRGYQTHRRLVVPPANGAQVELDVALAPEGGGLRPPAVIDPLPPFDDGPIGDAFGYLSVQTNPWTAVYVDGKAVGNTPLADYRVSAGSHSVVMENRDLGVRRKKNVFVRAGERIRIVEELK